MKIKNYLNFVLSGKGSSSAIEEAEGMMLDAVASKIAILESEPIIPTIKESTDLNVTLADVGILYEDGFEDGYRMALARAPKVKIVDGRRLLDKLTEEELSAAVLNDKERAMKEREKSRIAQIKQQKAVKLGIAAGTKTPEVPGAE